MSFYDSFSSFRQLDDERNTEIRRLRDAAAKKPISPKIGDRVLVAIGLIGHGVAWLRHECVVVDVSKTAIKVEWPRVGHTTKELGPTHSEWVDRPLVTDIIKCEAVESPISH